MFNFFKKILTPFSKMKSALGQKVRALFVRDMDESAFSHLEQLFYEADLGRSIAAELVAKLRSFARKNPDPEAILPFLKSELLTLFSTLRM